MDNSKSKEFKVYEYHQPSGFRDSFINLELTFLSTLGTMLLEEENELSLELLKNNFVNNFFNKIQPEILDYYLFISHKKEEYFLSPSTISKRDYFFTKEKEPISGYSYISEYHEWRGGLIFKDKIYQNVPLKSYTIVSGETKLYFEVLLFVEDKEEKSKKLIEL